MDADFPRIGHFARWEPALQLMAVGTVLALTGFVFWRLACRDTSIGASTATDPVDQSSEDSFPASDPPAFNARGPG
jgi:hypothetical protein